MAKSSDQPEPAEARGSLLHFITSPLSSRFLDGQLAFMQRRGWACAVGVGPPAGKAGASGGSEPEFDPGVDVFDVGFAREIRPIADVRSLICCIRLIRRVQPTIVNVSTPKAALIGMIAAWIMRVPNRVYVVRGLRYETMSGRVRSIFVMIERFIADRAHVVVFNSQSLRAIAEKDGLVRPGCGVVLAGGSGNGIAVDRFSGTADRSASLERLGLEEAGMTIGYLGRLTHDKGIGELVDAFVPLSERNPGVRLLLIGSYEDGDPLDDRTRRVIADHERIHHLGWTDDVEAVYGALDVLAFPSHREGLPNVLLEAQLCGVPVVGYRATGVVDAVDEPRTARLVDVGDVGALTATLEELLNDDESRRDMGRAGQDWVRSHFDRQHVWSALGEVYDSLDV